MVHSSSHHHNHGLVVSEDHEVRVTTEKVWLQELFFVFAWLALPFTTSTSTADSNFPLPGASIPVRLSAIPPTFAKVK